MLREAQQHFTLSAPLDCMDSPLLTLVQTFPTNTQSKTLTPRLSKKCKWLLSRTACLSSLSLMPSKTGQRSWPGAGEANSLARSWWQHLWHSISRRNQALRMFRLPNYYLTKASQALPQIRRSILSVEKFLACGDFNSIHAQVWSALPCRKKSSRSSRRETTLATVFLSTTVSTRVSQLRDHSEKKISERQCKNAYSTD